MKVSRLPGSLAKGAMVRAGSMVTGNALSAADSHAGSTPTSTLTVSALPSATSGGSAASAEGTVVVAVVGSTDVVVTPELVASSSASAGAVVVGASETSGGGGVLSAAGAGLVGTIRTETGVVAAGPALDNEAS